MRLCVARLVVGADVELANFKLRGHAPPHMQERKCDIAVVGAGVIGLSLALAAARRGKQVVLFERDARALGASVRNFGLVIPFSQSPGPLHERALRSREIWIELAQAIGFYHSPRGLVALAYHDDEQSVLEEYVEALNGAPHGRRFLTTTETRQLCPAVLGDGLKRALFSPTEVVVDPREAIRSIPGFLSNRYHVEYLPSTPVHSVTTNRIETTGLTWRADEIFVCSGSDFHSLYPEAHAASGLQRVKLQMLRTAPQPEGFHMGPAVCTGLSLPHYAAFKNCPSVASLRARHERDHPFLVKHGIHLLVTQTGQREITIGDSHEYGNEIDPFDSEAINAAFIEHLRTFSRFPHVTIQDRWHGVYAKHPTKIDLILEPEPGVTIVNSLGGAGMTLAFGLAEEMAEKRGW